jgi:hypothetical protein
MRHPQKCRLRKLDARLIHLGIEIIGLLSQALNMPADLRIVSAIETPRRA